MIIIGVYTTDSVYRGAYNLLAKSLDRVGLKYDYKAVPPNDWKAVNDAKPQNILNSLEKHKSPVLYLDADAFVHENIEPFFDNIGCDMAVNFIPCKDGSEHVLAGTIYFSYNEKVKLFIKYWMQLLIDNPHLHDQENLQKAIDEVGDKLDIYRLSSAYTYIFDRQYDDVEKPIIEHLQASREIYCRNEMGGFKNKLKKFLGLKVSKEELLKRRHVRLAELEKIIAEQ
ncbi:hypothetical protein EH243_02800 [Amphritea opalescens]|uniref:Nucleotide-diphospho-sugar transferase domain-containing protein n=1 Tax=Amphritea opalescens TaxID=2490544 RepID=A0A430KUH6_9GAMM|nr:hypothetical protein [Amphritea opalescens]RTE67152.1 hypothetical protein EH243_02800 [Amphritea opalescens]